MFKNIFTQTPTGSVNFGHTIIYGLIFALAIVTAVPARTVEVPVPVPVERVVKVPHYVNENDRVQINCLAENAYFEAGNQGTRGQVAVSNVVMNRVVDGRFPKTPCQVIKQRTRSTCQFSWVCAGVSIRDRNLYAHTLKVAEQVYLGNEKDVTGGATFYHNRTVRPSWSYTFRTTTVIGDHIFYTRR